MYHITKSDYLLSGSTRGNLAENNAIYLEISYTKNRVYFEEWSGEEWHSSFFDMVQ